MSVSVSWYNVQLLAFSSISSHFFLFFTAVNKRCWKLFFCFQIQELKAQTYNTSLSPIDARPGSIVQCLFVSDHNESVSAPRSQWNPPPASVLVWSGRNSLLLINYLARWIIFICQWWWSELIVHCPCVQIVWGFVMIIRSPTHQVKEFDYIVM